MPAPLPVTTVLKSSLHETFVFFAGRGGGRSAVIQASAGETDREVHDCGWFTNRHGMHRMSRQELQRVPGDDAPSGPFTIISGKSEGISPGVRMKDSKGRLYFVKFDARDYPEITTSAEVIVSKILYAV